MLNGGITRLILWVAALLLMGFVPAHGVTAQAATPEGTVAAFLDAWNAGDNATMYSYLAPQSRESFPQQVFENRYTVANEAMAFDGMTYEIRDIHYQGVTAAVTYDVVIQSELFGEIQDTDRVMRLVNAGERWGVAWSSMDIFDSLTSNATISSSGRLPPRAKIYDRNGNPIAETGTRVGMFTQRQNMTDETACQFFMANLTRRPQAAFLNLFQPYNSETLFFLEELNQADYNNNLARLTTTCGVRDDLSSNRQTRIYYGNNAMTHVVGYVGQMDESEQAVYTRRGYNPGDLIGKFGIEQQYERTLAGTPERILRITEPGGAVLAEFGSTEGSDPAPLMLTIDRDLQVRTVEALTDAYDYALGNWGIGAGQGAAVVLDVNSGAILSMASFPPLDPQLFDPNYTDPTTRINLLGQVGGDGRVPFRNHAIENQYTPGSVFKVITATAILNENIATPDTIFDCELRWEGTDVGDTLAFRQDWRVVDEMPPAGQINPAQAIMASCNPFFWEFGARMFNASGNVLFDYARDMGLGQSYQIYGGSVLEAGGLLNDAFTTDQAIPDAIGQRDVSLPPIQMAAATAAIANDGTTYKPYLVQQVGGMDGTEIIERFEPEVLAELDLTPGVLATVRQGMCGVTTNQEFGTAYRIFNDAPYSVCGKTGTAQTAARANAWFIAYAPAEDPQIAVAVAVAQAGREGSEVAAPITRRILDYYFNAELKPFPDWWAEEPFIPLDVPVGIG